MSALAYALFAFALVASIYAIVEAVSTADARLAANVAPVEVQK